MEPGVKAGFAQGLALLLPATTAVMGILLLVPVAPQMMQAFADTPGVAFLVPVLLTLPGLCIALFSPVAGLLGDRLGRRRLLLGAMLVYGLAGMAPMVLSDIYQILASRVLVGLCEALIMTLSTTLIGDLFTGQVRERWLSSQTAVASISALLFLALGGLLGRQGWQAPFLIYGLAWPMALAVFLLVREPVRGTRLVPGWSALPGRHVLLTSVTTILAAILFYTIQIHVSTVLPHFGVTDPARIGLFSAAASIGTPVGSLIFWAVAKRDVRLLLGVEFALMAAAFLGMARSPDAIWFIAAAFAGQMAAGLLLPTLLTWAMSPLAFEVRGRGMGVWQSSFAIGQFLSALVVPALSAMTGGTLPAFPIIAAGSLLVGLLSFLLLFRSRWSLA